MNEQSRIADAIQLIAAVPGYADIARDLSHARIRYVPHLLDRGQVTLGRTILLGSEPFAPAGELGLISLAGTLVHEHGHTRQNPFLKTVSFWQGVFTRTHPMRRYEWPAYRQQIQFLHALAASHASLSLLAQGECEAVCAAFTICYGRIPDAISQVRPSQES